MSIFTKVNMNKDDKLVPQNLFNDLSKVTIAILICFRHDLLSLQKTWQLWDQNLKKYEEKAKISRTSAETDFNDIKPQRHITHKFSVYTMQKKSHAKPWLGYPYHGKHRYRKGW